MHLDILLRSEGTCSWNALRCFSTDTDCDTGDRRPASSSDPAGSLVTLCAYVLVWPQFCAECLKQKSDNKTRQKARDPNVKVHVNVHVNNFIRVHTNDKVSVSTLLLRKS